MLSSRKRTRLRRRVRANMFKARNVFIAAFALAGCVLSLYGQQVAVVTELQGDATVTGTEGAQHSVHLLEWLEAGSTLTTPKGTRAVLVFSDGQRCEIGASSKASVTPQGPQRITGTVRTLPALPPMPPLSAIAPGQVNSDRAGALRLRSHEVEDLYPADPYAALPDHTVLRFRPIEGAATYEVYLVDAANKRVFHKTSPGNEIAVPSGTLVAGQRYHWSVTALPSHHYGQAEFFTLSKATLANRAAYRDAVAGSDRDAMLARLAVDRGLGLLIDVRDQLRTAVEQSPNDQPLQDLLKETESTLQPQP
jgi:hypothetical protein